MKRERVEGGRTKQFVLLVLLVLIAVGASFLIHGDGGEPDPPDDNGVKPPVVVDWSKRPRRDYRFEVAGPPYPWNFAVYVALTRQGEPLPVAVQLVLDRTEFAVPDQYEGDRWTVRSEIEPTEVERRMRWFFEETGVFGARTSITIPIPERPVIALTGSPKLELTDVITLANEEDGDFACAIRWPVPKGGGLMVRIWNGEQAHFDAPRPCPTRPFAFDDFGPGRRVVAARSDGRQWVALRTELVAGQTLTLDTAGAPEGGGTVVCASPDAVLLLDGDLPIPYPRITDLVVETVWKGVPPGAHAVRYPGGRTVAVTVEDGGTVRLPATPPPDGE